MTNHAAQRHILHCKPVRPMTLSAHAAKGRRLIGVRVVSGVKKALATACLLLAFAGLASGCAPLVVGGVGVAGAVTATEERGLGGFVSDVEIQTSINKLWFDHSVDLLNRLDMTVHGGRVLLTGQAKDAQQRLDAVRLAWQAAGVKEVINEIQVDENEGSIVDTAKDSWITAQIRGRLTVDLAISSQNYTIDTVRSVVYLMGVAKNQQELDAVLQHARSVGGVLRVVTYVRLPAAAPAS